MNTALVSVIIPAFNAEKFIRETIQSVLAQTYENFELIVVNDGSTDQTEREVGQFRDPRIQYFLKKNSGVSDSRNFGFEKSKGDLVAFLDADDLFLSDNLSQKVKALSENTDAALVHSPAILFDESGDRGILRGSGLEGVEALGTLLEFRATLSSPSSVLMRRECFTEVGGFDVGLSTSADWELWVRLASKWSFVHIPHPLIKYRQHSAQMHRNIRLMERDMNYALQKSYHSNIFKSEQYYRYCFAKHALILSGSFYHNAKDLNRAFRYWFRSLRASPRPFLEKLMSF